MEISKGTLIKLLKIAEKQQKKMQLYYLLLNYLFGDILQEIYSSILIDVIIKIKFLIRYLIL